MVKCCVVLQYNTKVKFDKDRNMQIGLPRTAQLSSLQATALIRTAVRPAAFLVLIGVLLLKSSLSDRRLQSKPKENQ
jgi:hypothetical protein